MSSMSVACSSTALKATDTYSRQVALLATSQVLLLHCASCARSEAAKRVTAAQLCNIFHDLLEQRSYMEIQLTPDHAKEFQKTMEDCKASKYFPPVCGRCCGTHERSWFSLGNLLDFSRVLVSILRCVLNSCSSRASNIVRWHCC